jgi:hypothetical protein
LKISLVIYLSDPTPLRPGQARRISWHGSLERPHSDEMAVAVDAQRLGRGHCGAGLLLFVISVWPAVIEQHMTYLSLLGQE